MERRLAIGSGLVVAAVLAGLLWYQLVRQPQDAEQAASATPTPDTSVVPLTTPEFSPLISTAPEGPDTTKGGLPTTLQFSPPPNAISPSAPTGSMLTMFMWLTSAIGGLGSLAFLLRRSH